MIQNRINFALGASGDAGEDDPFADVDDDGSPLKKRARGKAKAKAKVSARKKKKEEESEEEDEDDVRIL